MSKCTALHELGSVAVSSIAFTCETGFERFTTVVVIIALVFTVITFAIVLHGVYKRCWT